jgi:hypothetical protein
MYLEDFYEKDYFRFGAVFLLALLRQSSPEAGKSGQHSRNSNYVAIIF